MSAPIHPLSARQSCIEDRHLQSYEADEGPSERDLERMAEHESDEIEDAIERDREGRDEQP